MYSIEIKNGFRSKTSEWVVQYTMDNLCTSSRSARFARDYAGGVGGGMPKECVSASASLQGVGCALYQSGV